MATAFAMCDDPPRMDDERKKHLVSALLYLRARRQHNEMRDEMHFDLAAVIADCVRRVHRRRWAFERNERWFEDTLPHLGDLHFKQALRVSPSTFRYLLQSLRSLEREDTNMRGAISLEKRVAVGLYRLCSTAEDRTIAHLSAISRSTVNTIFREFCGAVIEHLKSEWLRMVRPEEMASHMRKFFALSGFPHAVGVLDGCHFPVSPPKLHAVDYHNYKGWYSIILLELVDHHYRFRYINLGSPGRCHDAHVYGRSRLCALVNGDHFRSPVTIIEETPVPPIILCDQAFPLTANLMKPFANASKDTPEAAFNYNPSKTRRIVENAYGRLKARFRFIMKHMECRIPTAKRAIRAACTLNNICEALKDSVEQQWLQEAQIVDGHYGQPSHNTDVCSSRGDQVRGALTKYFWKNAPHRKEH
ncbi:uncharacterized protein LOC135379146 [Ornithodoros turicata]|uniref:uncharacterized protein LOC135379146 n=1 Tax=Ornithodoros turicata TaxID=34597 RepID=UPI0031387C96